MENIYINLSKQIRPVKPMHSVNNGPAGSKVRGTSNFEWYRDAKIPFARNHDASFYPGYGGEHTVDVHRIFKRFEADAYDPASYNFESTDQYLADILESGTKVFYRLGASIEHGQKYGTYPPADFKKWAVICEHIIRHYNEGWAKGFHYNIEYWEIWNEPDCCNADRSNPCWQGTPEQFTELFVTALRHLKSCFPDLKIGGPAFCSAWDDTWNNRILSAVKDAGLPLDFFSFHGYTRYPADFRLQAQRARAALDSYGFDTAEIILNEWNYVKGWLNEEWCYSLRMEKGLKGAAFITASMICSQDSPMDHFMYYDARPCVMNGMFDTDTLQPLKGYYSFPMFASLYEIGTEVSCTCESDTVYAMAAANNESAAILVTNYTDDDEAPAVQTKLSLGGIPNGVWRAEFRLLDENHNNECIREEIITGNDAVLYMSLPLFGVQLITLQKIG